MGIENKEKGKSILSNHQIKIFNIYETRLENKKVIQFNKLQLKRGIFFYKGYALSKSLNY